MSRVTAVEARATPVAPEQLRGAIARAYVRVTGKPAAPGVLDALTAQASLETGRGKSMLNYNFGGIKGASARGETVSSKTLEVREGKTVSIVDGFRSYRGLDEGAEDYVRLMQHQFSSALGEAERGSIDGFAHELKKKGYYTAAETDYARALHALSTEAQPRGEAPARAPAKETATTALEEPRGRSPASIEIARVVDAMRRSMMRIAATEDEEAGSA